MRVTPVGPVQTGSADPHETASARPAAVESVDERPGMRLIRAPPARVPHIAAPGVKLAQAQPPLRGLITWQVRLPRSREQVRGFLQLLVDHRSSVSLGGWRAQETDESRRMRALHIRVARGPAYPSLVREAQERFGIPNHEAEGYPTTGFYIPIDTCRAHLVDPDAVGRMFERGVIDEKVVDAVYKALGDAPPYRHPSRYIYPDAANPPDVHEDQSCVVALYTGSYR